jgi:peptide/nickel transport system ATP-binding protein/energy-coupling factor transport system ATP-binding protein
VCIDEVVISRLGPRERARFRARHVGMISQYATETLAPDLVARDAVALQSRLLGTPRTAALHAADELLDEVGLGAMRATRTRSLSGGERQRVAVCAALAHGPRILLADEPTGELDTASAMSVHEMMARLIRERGATAIIVSHDATAAHLTDRALSIADGRLAEETTDGNAALVIGPGGWVRLPRDLLGTAALGERVSAEAVGREVRLRAIAPLPAPAVARVAPPRPSQGSHVDVVALTDVSRSFGEGADLRPVLCSVSARISAGTLTALVGRSGTGKSTLLHLIAGLIHPDSGAITVVGTRIDQLDQADAAAVRRSHIAMVTQDVGLVPFLSPTENVTMAMAIRNAPVDSELAMDTLRSVNLDGRATHLVENLSAGERQRAALARALASKPAVLLVDEPTSRLDRPNARAIADLLVEICHAHGTAVICATHDQEIVNRADAVIDLDAAEPQP